MMRPRLTAASPRTAIVAVALTTLVLSACTSSGAPSSPRARTDEPVDEGLAEEIAEQQEGVDERTEALEDATEAGTLGIVEAIQPRPLARLGRRADREPNGQRLGARDRR